jgi:hypothetical protein
MTSRIVSLGNIDVVKSCFTAKDIPAELAQLPRLKLKNSHAVEEDIDHFIKLINDFLGTKYGGWYLRIATRFFLYI